MGLLDRHRTPRSRGAFSYTVPLDVVRGRRAPHPTLLVAPQKHHLSCILGYVRPMHLRVRTFV